VAGSLPSKPVDMPTRNPITARIIREKLAAGRPGIAFIVLIVFFSLNLLLGTFNLLPVPPLDGSTGIMIFMSESTAQKYLNWLRGNSYAMLGLLLGLLLFNQVYRYIEAFATNILLRGHF
jgi:Zn-dependent protease